MRGTLIWTHVWQCTLVSILEELAKVQTLLVATRCIRSLHLWLVRPPWEIRVVSHIRLVCVPKSVCNRRSIVRESTNLLILRGRRGLIWTLWCNMINHILRGRRGLIWTLWRNMIDHLTWLTQINIQIGLQKQRQNWTWILWYYKLDPQSSWSSSVG